jgi:glutaminyl-peptide cyclotransferase
MLTNFFVHASCSFPPDVPILHLIVVPFPAVWHTPADNADAVDYTSVANINKIMRVFVAEYLQLRP